MAKKITPHFTWSEMTRTDTGLSNTPDDVAKVHLVYLCRSLERVRRTLNSFYSSVEDVPIKVNSAYRSKEVNKAVGGSSTSYHLDGRAVDIDITSYTDRQLDILINALYDENPSEILVRSSYIHFAI